MNRSFISPDRGVVPSVKQRPQSETLRTSAMKEKEEELALFLEMRRLEKERNNLHNSEEFDASLGSSTGSSHLFNIETATSVRKSGADDLLNSESDKSDYEWLLTPPATPLFPSLEMESPQIVTSSDGPVKSRPTALKSRLANSQPGPASRSDLGPQQSPYLSPSVNNNNNSSTVTRSPSSSGGSGSVSGTPSIGDTLISKSSPKSTPSTVAKPTSTTSPKSTPSTVAKPQLLRSLTPTRSTMISAKSFPARSSTPTPRSTTLSAKSTLPTRSSTPTARSATLSAKSTLPTRSSTSTPRSATLSTKSTLPARSSMPMPRSPTLLAKSTLPARSSTPTPRSPTLSAKSTLPARSSTPTPRPATLSAKSTLPARSSTPTPRSTTLSAKSTLPVRSSTPTPRSTTLQAKSTLPARSSTPTPRSTVYSTTKSTLPSKTSTPSVRSTARSSTPTARPTGPASKPTVRPSTPTLRPTNTSAPPVRSPTTRNSVSLSANSSTVKHRPWKPSEMPGYTFDTPPNLRTSLPGRPVSATRGRVGAPSVRSSSVDPVSNIRLKRQSCSPSRGRAAKVSGSSVPVTALSRLQSKANDNMSPVLYGTKMVERMVNMRKLAPPKQDDKHSPHSNLSGKSSSSPDKPGFGRTLSKKSLDMAMRHMDIRQQAPSNLRPLMTNIRATSMYSVRMGPSQSRPISISDSPHATSSNASSEMSVNNNNICFNGSQVDADINSDDKGVRSPGGMQAR